ncbi:outer membrane lipoprotein chaperone LolA [Jeongeupia sp. USM3]|uniref:outer membrane lipoprotein chaperone LolA n=1 Tax=Jeongeupia sp. USM3 TaxID=1906741 RepID=UPI00089DDB57|nr:outer membrane lipoprotein chaperone LolA [Jeongeupia sp. USM3]AOX98996.1 outer membrane lipoprotein carrier protein LolA [Jeongeupia sp. USM3]
MKIVRWLPSLILSCSALAHADGVSDLKRFLSSTAGVQGQFNQVVSGKPGSPTQISNGDFAIQRPGKFRWNYRKPYEQLIVGDGKRVWLYDPELRQATSKQLSAALESSPAALLAGDNALDKTYTLRNLANRDGLSWVEAVPKSKESTFDSIRLGLKNAQVVAMELQDHFGQTTKVTFSGLTQNPKQSADLFRFTPPKDVDVVEE